MKDRHWKEHLFVAAMPVFIDIVGFIASVIALAEGLRNLITEIFGESSGCFRFANYLTEVEHVLTLYMNQAWQEIYEIRRNVERVRGELERARNLVSHLRNTNGLWRIMKADRYAKDLEKSQAEIGRYLGLMSTAALAHVALPRTAQDGQEHNGNEDLDHAYALLLHEEQLREANPRVESSQASRDEEIARAMQAAFDEEEETAGAMQALLLEEEEKEIARAMQASLDEEEQIAIAIRVSLEEFVRDLRARDAGASS